MTENREQRLIDELDRLAVIVALVVLVGLAVLYFSLATSSALLPMWRDFLSGIIVNLIPVLLVAIVSYVVLRRIQILRSEQQMHELVIKISNEIESNLGRLTSGTSETCQIDDADSKDLMIQGPDGIPYLLDRYGLPHPIRDEDTALYIMQTLGYQPTQLKKTSAENLVPVGAEVTAIRSWSRPRTVEDEMSWEAQNKLNYLGKDLSTRDGASVLSFRLRNDGDTPIHVFSATLVFNMAGPFAISDISHKNKPTAPGLLKAMVIFDGEEESGIFDPHKEYALDLILTKTLSQKEPNTIQGKPLGYIKVIGLYLGTNIDFNIYV